MNPLQKKPVLITIGHASTFVPADIRRLMTLSDKDIQKNADLYTDLIYDIPSAHVVKAKISRLVVDVNRAPDDIESESELCSEGVVVRITRDGRFVYNEEPKPESISRRIETYHHSFHEEVERYIDDVKLLIDGHSMWSISPKLAKNPGASRADIVLGNRRYATCNYKITKFFRDAFSDLGYNVKLNDPFEGHYIIGYHCSRRRTPGLQIEINKRLYLDEKTLEKNDEQIAKLNGQLKEIVERVEAVI